MLLPSPEQEKQLKQLDDSIAATKKLETAYARADRRGDKREKKLKDQFAEIDKLGGAIKWTPLIVTDATSTGARAQREKDAILATGPTGQTGVHDCVAKLRTSRPSASMQLPDKSLPGGGPGRFSTGTPVDRVDAASSDASRRRSQSLSKRRTRRSSSLREQNPYRKYPAQAAIDGDKFGASLGWDRRSIQSRQLRRLETAADLGAADELLRSR